MTDQERKERRNASSMKYNAAKVTQFKIALNNRTDADIISILETKSNKQGYIKDLIRQDNNIIKEVTQ